MQENQIQSRKWLLTINNPQDHGMTHDVIIDRAQKFNPDYFCMADEIGESGTYHTHVFLCSSSPMRFGTVKKRFPTAHIDKANGTTEDNRAYIRKEGKWAETRKSETSVESTFKEFGELPDEATEKSPKYAKLLQCVKDGMTNQEILAIDPSFAFHLEHIDKLRQDIRIHLFILPMVSRCRAIIISAPISAAESMHIKAYTILQTSTVIKPAFRSNRQINIFGSRSGFYRGFFEPFSGQEIRWKFLAACSHHRPFSFAYFAPHNLSKP